MYREDTIAAIATPIGEGGIGIVRISGEDAEAILKDIFVTKNGKKIEQFKDRHFYYGKVLNSAGQVIDEVLAVLMRGPRSYTTEDVVEIHCHGGMIPVRNILKAAIEKGARLAEPGEFTKRAFLNGRIDLAQAEAIMDLICTKSERAAQISVRQLEGGLSKYIGEIRNELLDIMAHIEVTIDYPEEDIEEVTSRRVEDGIKKAIDDIGRLLDTAERGKLIKNGIKTVIIGKPNVGKSSLLNALVRENRAIVTDIPGTTRDVIEEYINIKGVNVRIVDTAGIRETLDQIEKIGVERSKESIKDADLIIMVVDVSRPLEKEDELVIEWLSGRKSIVVANKIDKPVLLDIEILKEKIKNTTIVETSLITGKGIEKLEDIIYNMFFEGEISVSDDIMITNMRHQEALVKAKSYLEDVLQGIQNQIPLDLVSIDLRSALESLGMITGETVTEDLIDKIFSDFCLGK